MNAFVISLSVSLILLSLRLSECRLADFCDVQSFDTVFNIGHYVYFVRCGEVWTYDPRMYEGDGGFIRDYSIYSFARANFKAAIEKKYKGIYDSKYLRFTVFSIQELDCRATPENVIKNCHRAIKKWNHMTVMLDNKTAITFKYDHEISYTNDSNNALQFPAKQDMDSNERHQFWPNVSQITNPYEKRSGKAIVYSTLFVTNKHTLYVVLYLEKTNEFLLTYVQIEEFMYDNSKLSDPNIWGTLQWARAEHFTGHVIGLFYQENRNKVFLVGRINHIESPVFEDQLYSISGANGLHVDFTPEYQPLEQGSDSRKVRTSGDLTNVRIHFGCDPEPPPETSPSSSRMKRSIKESESMPRLSWEALHRELRDDWIQLSIMSFVALFLLLIIFKLSKN